MRFYKYETAEMVLKIEEDKQKERERERVCSVERMRVRSIKSIQTGNSA